AGGAPPGYPILTFTPVITPPAQDARTIAAAIRFSDVTTTVGLGGVPPLPDTAGDVALAIGDYDRDGAEDVFVGAHLFHNELAHATETTDRAGIRLRDRAGGAVAATFGDYDNDGRPDLYVATASGGALFRNAGDSTFTDVTAAAGLGGAPPATAALFVDLDHDGDLDLFLGTPSGNRVYRNVLGGRFAEMAGPIGLGAGGGGTRDAGFGDLDAYGLLRLRQRRLPRPRGGRRPDQSGSARRLPVPQRSDRSVRGSLGDSAGRPARRPPGRGGGLRSRRRPGLDRRGRGRAAAVAP